MMPSVLKNQAVTPPQEQWTMVSSDELHEEAADCYELFDVDKWQRGDCVSAIEKVALEIPLALVYNGISHVVMMATPHDLEELALGFSLSEGIIDSADQFYAMDINKKTDGIELNIEISTEKFVQLKHWRRNQTGRTGCGLCGAESLQQAIRPVPQVTPVAPVAANILQRAIESLSDQQLLQQQTGASHCAAWYDLEANMLMLKEDVGRHNALDKLVGGLHKQKVDLKQGFAVISSRASYEMVVKSCQAGISCLVAVSAPTALAINLARDAELTLIGFARPGRFISYSQPMVNAR
jgi:FdhD protein